MIVKRISALRQFMLKQTKKPINNEQLKTILSFRLVISLICQERLISLNYVLSLTKQTQTYEKSAYKLMSKKAWTQLGNVANTTKRRQRRI